MAYTRIQDTKRKLIATGNSYARVKNSQTIGVFLVSDIDVQYNFIVWKVKKALVVYFYSLE